jgi:choline dehydrogenase-like flavoprotein
MIRDLNEQQDHALRVEAEVLVIGAGIAGLVTATKLSECGLRVVIVESGGRTQDTDTHPLNRVEQTGQLYTGAEYRFRCLGGTSSRWGGAMIPFLPEDMDSHTAGWVPAWHVPYERLIAQLPDIEAKFGLGSGSYEDLETIGPHGPAAEAFVARLAKFGPFRRRNVALIFESALRATDGPEIWLNASVTEFAFNSAGNLSGATARSLGGKELQIVARDFVVAAGAIESTRLLLIADRQCNQRIFAPDDILGRFLSDHLSEPIAVLEPRNRIALNRVVGFRFERGAMRNLRFEMRGAARRQLGLPASFTHVAYEGTSDGGFEALRDIFQAIQKRRLPNPADIVRTAGDLPWLVRAVWWRYILGRLLYPSKGTFTAHLVIEQMPLRDNRITLSDSASDPFGLPQAKIHWHVGDEDLTAFRGAAERFLAMWRESRLQDLAELVPRDASVWRAALRNNGGMYHPSGTIRIGTDPSNGVVSADLQAFRVPNLYVVSTAIFPVAGGANPTLMMTLYGSDLAERLAAQRSVVRRR